MQNYGGIDLDSKNLSICILKDAGEILCETAVRTDESKAVKFFKGLSPMRFVVEASPLAEWLCGIVEECGHTIDIICPRHAKAVTQTGKKTDRLDAMNLARVCRGGWYIKVHRKSGDARELRSYLTSRKRLVQASQDIASSIRGIMRAHGIRLAATTDEKSFADKVRESLRCAPEMLSKAIEPLLLSWQELHLREKRMYKELKRLMKKSAVGEMLCSVPAIGPATAAAFVATIDNPERFPNSERVASYLGLVPRVMQSGETDYRGRITKTGDKLLRWLLVEAATVLLSRSRTTWGLRAWGLKLQESRLRCQLLCRRRLPRVR